MSFTNPALNISRRSVVGVENEWVKMFDPPNRSPPTPDHLDLNNLPAGVRANPVPEVMAAADLQITSVPHTVQRTLLRDLIIPTWDGLRNLNFFVFGDNDNPTAAAGNYPAATIRVPRGAVFHGETGTRQPPHTIHWHGIEPTPINDGVGHCSMEIGNYKYQWQANFIGHYFYHCHRNTVQHFEFGLFGLLLIETPDAYFASLNPDGTLNSIPIGAGRDGLRRIAANVASVLLPDGTIADFSAKFPGFNSNPIYAPDPWTGDPRLKFATDPHAMCVPFDREAFWVFDERDSTWSDLASDPFATFPRHGDQPGVNDEFHEHLGVNGFFAFNDFHPDYFFVTGVPVPAPVGGIGTIDPAGAPPRGGGLPDGLIPPALNSGVFGTQVSIKAKVNQTILIRALDAAYAKVRLTLPVDMVIISWDGRSLGIPPFAKYNKAFLLPANTPLEFSVARRINALIRETTPISSFAMVEFLDTRGDDVVMTARIPIDIEDIERGAGEPFAISGSVTDRSGAPLAGITMTLTGAVNITVLTDASGNYSFTGLANGTYTVTPSLASFPPRRNVIINGAVVIGRDFRGINIASALPGGGGSGGGGGGGVGVQG